MSSGHQLFDIQIESEQSEMPIDASVIASAFASDLIQDNVARWVNDVQTAIESAKCLSIQKETAGVDQLASRRTSIEIQIAKLQKQLQDMALD